MSKKKRAALRTALIERRKVIHSADRLLMRADTVAARPSSNADLQRANVTQAVLFYECAAHAYARTSLSLMSRKAWQATKDCYQNLGDQSGVQRCDEHLAAIPFDPWDLDPNSSY